MTMHSPEELDLAIKCDGVGHIDTHLDHLSKLLTMRDVEGQF